MASRYTQEYFFQHTLMHVSFKNWNEIIHPNAGNVPEYIPHYASAIFVNGSFWNDSSKILDEIKFEGHHNDYIQSNINFINMQCKTHNLVTKGKFLKWQIRFFLLLMRRTNIVHITHILLIFSGTPYHYLLLKVFVLCTQNNCDCFQI